MPAQVTKVGNLYFSNNKIILFSAPDNLTPCPSQKIGRLDELIKFRTLVISKLSTF